MVPKDHCKCRPPPKRCGQPSLEFVMRAAQFPGGSRIEITEAPVPAVAQGEVLLKVLRTALCGSDIKAWRKGARCTPGHEIVGVVVDGDPEFAGQRCAVYIPVHCGQCPVCLDGGTQMCERVYQLIGWDRPGGYAEYLTVPSQCLLQLPDDIEDSLAPLLLDTIGTSAHAVRTAVKFAAQPEPLLITGAGPVGLGALITAKSLGYSDIYVSDPNERRLRHALKLGGKPYHPDSKRYHFPLILECSGAHAARNNAIELVTPKGCIVLVGENSEPWVIQEGPVFRRKDFSMVRTFYFPRSDHADNIRLLRKWHADFETIVDKEFALADLPCEFEVFARGGTTKPLLAFG